jgi:hypothetical protein
VKELLIAAGLGLLAIFVFASVCTVLQLTRAMREVNELLSWRLQQQKQDERKREGPGGDE